MYKRIGGIHWFRLGKFRFAFCKVKPKVAQATQSTVYNAQHTLITTLPYFPADYAEERRSYWIDDETGEVVR